MSIFRKIWEAVTPQDEEWQRRHDANERLIAENNARYQREGRFSASVPVGTAWRNVASNPRAAQAANVALGHRDTPQPSFMSMFTAALKQSGDDLYRGVWFGVARPQRAGSYGTRETPGSPGFDPEYRKQLDERAKQQGVIIDAANDPIRSTLLPSVETAINLSPLKAAKASLALPNIGKNAALFGGTGAAASVPGSFATQDTKNLGRNALEQGVAGAVLGGVGTPAAAIVKGGAVKLAEPLFGRRSATVTPPDIAPPGTNNNLSTPIKPPETTNRPAPGKTTQAEDSTVPQTPEPPRVSPIPEPPKAPQIDIPKLSQVSGLKPDTVQQLINEHGVDNTASFVGRLSTATGVKNPDAFAIAEARKQFGTKVVEPPEVPQPQRTQQPEKFETPMVRPAGTEPQPKPVGPGGVPLPEPPASVKNTTAPVPEPPVSGREGIIRQIKQAEEEAAYRSEPLGTKAKNYLARRLDDPWADAYRYDKMRADQMGLKSVDDLPPEESLQWRLSRLRNTNQEKVDLLQGKREDNLGEYAGMLKDKDGQVINPSGRSALKLAQEYQPGTQAEKELFTYAFNRFDREYRNVHGRGNYGDDTAPRIQKDLSDVQLDANIKAYERANPDAQSAAGVLKELNDEVLNYAVRRKGITPETAKFVQGTYKEAVPLGRVLAEDTPQVKVVGGTPSVASQRAFVQSLRTSKNPLDPSWKVVEDRVNRLVYQGRKNELDNLMLNIAQEGKTPGFSVKRSPEQLNAISGLRSAMADLSQIRKDLKNQARNVRGQSRTQNVRTQQAEAAARDAARQHIKALIPEDDPGALAAVDSLTDQELYQALDELGGTGRVSMSLKNNRQYSAALENRLNEIKTQLDEISEDYGTLRGEAEDYRTDLEVGRGYFKGQKEGQTFVGEMPIDLAKGLNDISEAGWKDLVSRLSTATATLQKISYTGVLNPGFKVINVLIKNPGLMFMAGRGLSPFGIRAIGQGLRAFTTNSPMMKALKSSGAKVVNFTEIVSDRRAMLDVLAAKGSVGNYLRFAAKNPTMAWKDGWNFLNTYILGALDNMQRGQVAAGEMYRLDSKLASQAISKLKRGEQLDDAERALFERGARAFNEVLGDLSRGTRWAQSMEGLVPYTVATQTGVRAWRRAITNRPLEGLIKTGTVGSGLYLTVTYALGAPGMKDYFEDMKRMGNEYQLDGFLTVPIPGQDVHKITKEEAQAMGDPDKEGQWTGFIKIPIAPDFRPLNRGIREAAEDGIQASDLDPVHAARSMFDWLTGDYVNQVIDRQSGLVGGNPLVQTGKILLGINPRTVNDPLINPYLGSPESSEAGISLADMFGISPAQADALLGQIGIPGRSLKKDQSVGESIGEYLKGQFTPSRGLTEGGEFYKRAQGALDSIKVTPASDSPTDQKAAADQEIALKNAFGLYLKSSKVGDLPWEGQAKAEMLLWLERAGGNDKPLWNALRQVYGGGDNPHPMWKLPDEQFKQLLILKHFDPHWSGLSAPADEAQKDLIRNQDWYKQYQQEMKAYVAKLPQEIRSGFSEDEDYIVPNATVEEKLQRLDAITDDKEKSKFIQANPDLTEYFNQVNSAKQRQREDMGLIRDVTPQQEAALNEYSRLKSLGQEKGFVSAHPELGALFGAMKGISGQAEVLEANAEGRAPKLEGSGFKKGGGGRRRGRRGGGGGRGLRLKSKGSMGRKKTAKVSGSVKLAKKGTNIKGGPKAAGLKLTKGKAQL